MSTEAQQGPALRSIMADKLLSHDGAARASYKMKRVLRGAMRSMQRMNTRIIQDACSGCSRLVREFSD